MTTHYWHTHTSVVTRQKKKYLIYIYIVSDTSATSCQLYTQQHASLRLSDTHYAHYTLTGMTSNDYSRERWRWIFNNKQVLDNAPSLVYVSLLCSDATNYSAQQLTEDATVPTADQVCLEHLQMLDVYITHMYICTHTFSTLTWNTLPDKPLPQNCCSIILE